MRAVAALVRASWRTARTYRLDLVFSLGGLIVSIVPLYFVAGALQPTMAEAIEAEGGEYFAFLIVGMVALSFLSTAVNRLPDAISSSVTTGTLEALFSTPAGFPKLLTGLSGYGFLWTSVRALLLLFAGALLGADFAPGRIPAGLFVLGLVVVTHIPFGLLGAAAVLAFRTTGPFPRVVVATSGLLGGVYYPTHVIPSWLEHLSAAVPLTYGLRALRKIWLEGQSIYSVAGDIAILCSFLVALALVGGVAFMAALRYARRTGSLSQY